MNRLSTPTHWCSLVLLGLLAGCTHGSSSNKVDESSNVVAVTTTMPVRQPFHDTVEALGSVMGDPHAARTLSLAYGGQIIELKVISGEHVHRDQRLLLISPDPTARSAYQQARAALHQADDDLKHIRELAAQRLATRSQVAAARKVQADALAALQAQKAIGGGAAQVPVNAPANGVVTGLRVHLGDRFAANAALLDFTPTRALVAQLGVPPESGGALRTGMHVQLSSVYGPTNDFSGTLQMIGQSIDPQTHLLPVQVQLPAAASTMLVSGAAVTAHIQTGNFSAWAVPRAALLHDEHGDYVFQVEHAKAKRINVKLRSPDGDTVGVQGPLNVADPVIVLGVYELGDGDPVKATATSDSVPATGNSSPSSPETVDRDSSK